MSKVVVVNCCDDCPYFNNTYWSYDRECMELHKVNEDFTRTVLPNCPLTDKENIGEIYESTR